jgi:hypothetical protein
VARALWRVSRDCVAVERGASGWWQTSSAPRIDPADD